MTKSRIAHIDCLKALAIFLVCLGHTTYGDSTAVRIEDSIGAYVIVTFHMPLFAVLSGLFFNGEVNAITFAKKKFTQIALPFITWCFIDSIILNGIPDLCREIFTNEGDIHFKPILEWWVISFVMDIMVWKWWFLRSLFLSFMLAYLSYRLCKRFVLISCCLSVLCLSALYWTGIIPNKCQSGFLFLYPFFCVGMLIKNYAAVIEKHSRIILCLSIVAYAVCMMFWNGKDDTFYDMNTSMVEHLGNAGITGIYIPIKQVFRFVIGTSASVCLLLGARQISKFIPRNDFVLKVGSSSIGIYILHSYVGRWISSFYLWQDYVDSMLLSIFIYLLLALVNVIVSYLIFDISSRNSMVRLFLWGRH